MQPLLIEVAAWLDVAGIGPWARGSANVYPVANVLHLLGLVMLVGGIGVVDLRIAGAWRALPLAPLSAALVPVAIAGLMILVPTGIILFAADGRALAGSVTFHWKLAAILLALANAGWFRRRWRRRGRFAGRNPPASDRVMALASLGLWLAVAWLGRMIAYS